MVNQFFLKMWQKVHRLKELLKHDILLFDDSQYEKVWKNLL